MAATMKDVARLSGVSLATVSAVLSGSSYVSPDLTQRVQRAVQTLGYAPNSVARSLKKGATKLIGLVVPDVTNPFFTGIVHAVQKRARTLGYSVVLCDSERDVEQERSYLKMLRAHLAVGTLFCPSGPEEAYKRLEDDIGIMPVICVDHAARPGDFDSVVLDNIAAARLATQHVLALGHKRIAIVAGPQHLMPGRDRLIGFEQTLHDAGLNVAPELIRQGAFGEAGAFDAVQALLTLADRPSAIFVTNNQMLIGAMRAIAESALSCPRDISVVAIDDFPWAAAFSPALTTVRQPVDAMAEAALDMLVERVQGKRGPPRHRVFAPELAVRRSCGAPPEHMPARARTPRGKSAREAKQVDESKVVLSNT